MLTLLKAPDVAGFNDIFTDITAPTQPLFENILTSSCRRFRLLRYTPQARRLDRLISDSAWIDAALTLLAIEQPQWQLRRLAYDNGEWYCALSRQREMPDWLDQSVETHHADASLAILRAYMELIHTSPEPKQAAISRRDGGLYEPLCCENF